MLILAIDQGTTGTRSILFNEDGEAVRQAYREFRQIYPKPGWVEHDPIEIWNTVVETVQEVCASITEIIAGVGITNQRETTVLWDRSTGKPIYNAIVWQCRRTTDTCKLLESKRDIFRVKTGLTIDPYFSGTKIHWILENTTNFAHIDNLAFGTIDSWLIWKLTGAKVHATDYTNASRTLIFNIIEKKWDSELCDILNIPIHILPEVKTSISDYGEIESIPELHGIPILGVAGDQQAALFGQFCVDSGSIKNTYGTGCFLMLNTGEKLYRSEHGLLSTIAIDLSGRPCYALEGSVFIGGAVIQWIRDELAILSDSAESENIAQKVKDNGGVYIVPAFVGLGAPYWDMEARGIVTGLTRGANRNHFVRAALESMAYQSYDVLRIMCEETGMNPKYLAVDGGATRNNFLMQFQADILGIPVHRPANVETTACGAAYLVGLNTGIWKSLNELKARQQPERIFTPRLAKNSRSELLSGWQKAIRQALTK